MDNYTIGETFTLPSNGKLYGKENGVITLKSMTTEQEQKRLATTDYPYRMLCEIIDDCIVDGIGVSSYDMCVGDYQYLLYKLRTVTYGAEYQMDSKCPYCGFVSKEVVNLDELPSIEYTEAFETFREFELPKSKVRVRLNVQTPRLLDKVIERTREFRKKFPDASDQTLTFTIEALIDTVDGEKPDPINLSTWIRNLPMMDTNTIITYAEKMNAMIGVNTTLELTCDLCGLIHTGNMSITKEFFRPSLNL